MRPKWKVEAISFKGGDVHLIAPAKAKALAQRSSFSNYVVGLIEKDLNSGHLLHDAAAAPVPEKLEPVKYKLSSKRGANTSRTCQDKPVLDKEMKKAMDESDRESGRGGSRGGKP